MDSLELVSTHLRENHILGCWRLDVSHSQIYLVEEFRRAEVLAMLGIILIRSIRVLVEETTIEQGPRG